MSRRTLRLPLAAQLALAFFAVSSLSLLSVAAVSTSLTRSEFRTLLGEQERQRLETQLQAHLDGGGQLDDFRPAPTTQAAGPLAPPPAGPTGRGGHGRGTFVVTDPQFRPVDHAAAAPLPPRERRQAAAVRRGGQVVAYLVPQGRPAIEGAANAAFVRRTTRAVAWATLVSGGLAGVAGWWLARRLLRPLQELRGGIAALRRGEEPRPPAARPVHDELGELLAAFEQMHGEVVQAQQAGRQLTADIAHDLNTPLTVMRGGLDAMLDGTLPPTPARLERLNAQARHMTRLVADLRLLAQTDAGELRLQPEPLDLTPWLRGVAEAYAPLAQERGLRLEVRASAALPARLDPHRLRQVLDNLLGNAMTHTPAGGTVTLAATGQGGGVAVTVLDTGPGVGEAQLPHLFERLYRADSARPQHAGAAALGVGSGLGLAICRGLVTAQGGWIQARNRPPAGLEVTFWLPSGPER